MSTRDLRNSYSRTLFEDNSGKACSPTRGRQANYIDCLVSFVYSHHFGTLHRRNALKLIKIKQKANKKVKATKKVTKMPGRTNRKSNEQGTKQLQIVNNAR